MIIAYKPRIKIEAVSAVKYQSIDGHVVQREKGQIVNAKGDLISVKDEWVFRNAGGYVDHDWNLNDLCERHNIRITPNDKE